MTGSSTVPLSYHTFSFPPHYNPKKELLFLIAIYHNSGRISKKMQSFKILNARMVNITIQQNSLPSKETGQYKSFQNISHSHWPSSSPDALPGSPPHPSSSLATPSSPTEPCPGIITITFSIWTNKKGNRGRTLSMIIHVFWKYFQFTFEMKEILRHGS